MGRLSTVLAMPPADKLAAAEALAMLAAARFLIRFVRFARWRRWLGAVADPAAAPAGPGLTPGQLATARRVQRLVTAVARRAPFAAVCLPQALAARWMLGRRGIATQLYIGVRRGAGGGHEYHAWLEAQGVCLTGGAGREGFVPFGRSMPPVPR